MADKRISDLTALTGANVADTDLLPIVDTSAAETKKITFAEFKTALDTSTGFVRITGDTMTGDLSFGDNNKAIFGAGSDLQIYHDSSNSYIADTGTGDLYIQAGNEIFLQNTAGVTYFYGNQAGQSTVGYAGVAKLATTATGIDVTGNIESDSVTIGVGAVAGTEKLRVNGTILTLGGTNAVPAVGIGDVNTGIYAPTVGTLGWTINGTQRLLLNSTGIDVTGTVVADGLTVDGLVKVASNFPLIDFDEQDTTDLNTRVISTDGQFRVQSSNNGFNTNKNRIIVDHATGDINFYATNGITQAFHWDAADQRLGIGTTLPADKLSVWTGSATGAGQISIGRTSADGGVFVAGGANQFFTSTAQGDIGLRSDGGDLWVGTAGADVLHFVTNNSEKVRIDSSGRFLVGCTAQPSSSVNGFGVLSTGILIGSVNSDKVAVFNRNTSDGEIVLLQKSGTTVASIGISQSGSVPYIGGTDTGICFNSATNGVLPADTSNPTAVQIDAAKDLGFSTVRWRDLYLSGGVSNPAAGGTLTFGTVGSERMRIDSSGNLLVGTTTVVSGSNHIVVGSNAIHGVRQTFTNLSTSDVSFGFSATNAGMYSCSIRSVGGAVASFMIGMTYNNSSLNCFTTSMGGCTAGGASGTITGLNSDVRTYTFTRNAGTGVMQVKTSAVATGDTIISMVPFGTFG